jgi:hypothetical protein
MLKIRHVLGADFLRRNIPFYVFAVIDSEEAVYHGKTGDVMSAHVKEPVN